MCRLLAMLWYRGGIGNTIMELVSWEFNDPFQHKYGYIRDKRSGVESYPYPVKEGHRYINLNPGSLFVQ